MILRHLIVYPIKSLDGVSLPKVEITQGGILQGDRVYALEDAEGNIVNAKRTPLLQLLRTIFDDHFQEVGLRKTDETTTTYFSLAEPLALNRWLSNFLGFHVHLITETQRGFPDDQKASGPTLVSAASLEDVTAWFPGLTLESIRRRFRTNLEISDVPPFWEDHLFGPPDELVPFTLGEVELLGHNPCQRCAVPTRDPDHAIVSENFQKTFMAGRQKHLPAWANRERFNHFYRLAVNTSVPVSEQGKILQVGDPLHLSR